MTDESKEIAPGITVNTKGGFGQPVVKGTGVPVAELLAALARGADAEKLALETGVAKDGLCAALSYAAEIIGEEPSSRLNERFELSPGVISDGRIRFGKPIVEGTRIDVALILDNLAAGQTLAELLESYPSLTPEGVRAALGYAQRLIARESVSVF